MPFRFPVTTLFLLICPAVLAAQAPFPDAKQQQAYIKAHYTKYEYRIPVRDGKRLFTAVYVPKDTAHKCPILLLRTPYSVRPYGVDQYRPNLGIKKGGIALVG